MLSCFCSFDLQYFKFESESLELIDGQDNAELEYCDFLHAAADAAAVATAADTAADADAVTAAEAAAATVTACCCCCC